MIDELSEATVDLTRYIVKIRKMISLGMLPDALIDAKKAYIMLNRESYIVIFGASNLKLKKRELEGGEEAQSGKNLQSHRETRC